jgi:Tol biopolymer transport system component
VVLIFSLLFANKIMTGSSSQTTGDTITPARQPTFTAVTLTYHTLTAAAVKPFGTLTPSATPLPPTATSTLAPPQCTFPLAETTEAESTPEEYTFSEPQVVLTDELQPDIVDWLPDNQNVLIMPLKLIDLGMNGYQQTIELFNPETGKTQIYATRRRVNEAPPAWNPALNAIVYPAMNVLEGSTITDFRFTRQVMISYGNPDNTQILADNLPQYYVAVKPDGSQIAYLLDKQLFRLNVELKPLFPISFDREQWDYLHENKDDVTVDYRMAWRPNSPQIFLYNWAFDNLGYTYILDTDTGQLCNLNFGGWALSTRWSPNGRYLAIIRAQDDVPVQSTDLAVLDIATGNLYILGIPQEIGGRHLIKDIDWAPDNRHLFIVGKSDVYRGMLFLGDFMSQQIDRILPSYEFMTVEVGTNLAWSPDGSKLLLNCSISEEAKQLCLIFVQTDEQ